MHRIDQLISQSRLSTAGISTKAPPVIDAGISFEELDATLCFHSSGRTMTWMGPALRGVVAAELKRMTCRWPEEMQASDWRYCKGCEHIHGCSYGCLFESEPLGTAAKSARYSDGMRAITLSPDFPGSTAVSAGDTIQLRILLLGDPALGAKEQLFRALHRAGQGSGLGPDRAKFQLSDLVLERKGLIRAADCRPQLSNLENRVDGIRVHLVSPLFMKDSGSSNKSKRNVLSPSFEHLLRAGIRSVNRSFQMFTGSASMDPISLQQLIECCRGVKTRFQKFRQFSQRRTSGRTYQRYMTTGVWGEVVFDSVPETLIPWIIWGGFLGCGQHRVAGAGRWTVTHV